MARNRNNLKTSALLALLVLVAPATVLAVSAKDNYDWYCAQCHDSTGGGDGINNVDSLPVGPMDLSSPKEMAKFKDAQIIQTLTHGGPVNNLDTLMPPWGNRLTEAEIEELMRYVRSLCKVDGCAK